MVIPEQALAAIEERRERGHSGAAIEVQISLNGGRTWIAESENETPLFNQSRRFTVVPFLRGQSFTSPTVEISKNHFLTVFMAGPDTEKTTTIKGVLWHIDTVEKPEKK